MSSHYAQRTCALNEAVAVEDFRAVAEQILAAVGGDDEAETLLRVPSSGCTCGCTSISQTPSLVCVRVCFHEL